MKTNNLIKTTTALILAIDVAGFATYRSSSSSSSSCLRLNPPVSLTHRTLDESVADRGKDGDDKDIPHFHEIWKEIAKTLTTNQDFFPHDFDSYGPLLIRLAWHCAGSYRISDGRGGCDGGRIRFSPELNWEDNANLDNALKLLEPVKRKFPSISWGDLITLTGTVAIKEMGGPYIGFCGGRVDDDDGSDSAMLGPTKEQEDLIPCAVNGKCETPIGPTTIGLIYVNPEGPMGVPDLEGSARDVRTAFGRMGMTDRQTVALIGGGHAFGKSHGACPNPPCGDGVGANTYTSGIEGQWTTNPTKYSNEYFELLVSKNFSLYKGPGGKHQWRPENGPDTIMMTPDLALLQDPSYKESVYEFARNVTALTEEFGKAWYKLMTSDMGPATRCKGPEVPPPQPHQNPLPAPPKKPAALEDVKAAIRDVLKQSKNEELGPMFVDLTLSCASTFRITDYTGGCNGARIRFPPLSKLPSNAGLDIPLSALEPIKEKFGDSLTWSSLIVLAGQTVVESALDTTIPFKWYRSDATSGAALEYQDRSSWYKSVRDKVVDGIRIQGLTLEQHVALFGRPRSLALAKARGSTGIPTTEFSNKVYETLKKETWTNVGDEWLADGKDGLTLTKEEHVLVEDEALEKVVSSFASDEKKWRESFVDAWTKVVNADDF